MLDSYENTLLIKRVATGITGLDEILGGGLLQGGVYIIQGPPGSGKTVLGNEVCFRHASAGGRAAYVTLLAEMHTRMLQHLRAMSFFNESLIPAALYYISAFHILESSGLKGLIDVLRREIKGHASSLLVLDGLIAAQETAQTDREFKKFINEIQAHAVAYDCTVLLLTSSSLETVSAEHTMVDGVIELEDRMFGVRSERALTVRKFRGSAFLRGRHAFQITSNGIQLFPRLEAARTRASRTDIGRARIATGVPNLDELVGGGLPSGSATGLMGPTGSGKTLFGLHFLSLASLDEPGLHAGFLESPQALLAQADRLGLPLGEHLRSGALELIWDPSSEQSLDELACRLLAAVRRRQVKRLVIDGLGPYLSGAHFPERLGRFMTSLLSELGALGATSVLTLDIPGEPMGAGDATGSSPWPAGALPALLDNVILLRYLEQEGGFVRRLSIAKVRASPHDLRLRSYEITGRGLALESPASAAGIGGAAQPAPNGV